MRKVFKPLEHQEMLDQCCRLGFLLPEEKIDTIFKVYGDDIEVFDNTVGPNEELGEPIEPRHGWLMQQSEEGYPCDALTPDGCGFELKGKDKPWRCKLSPTFERKLGFITACGFTFKDGERFGKCTRCI